MSENYTTPRPMTVAVLTKHYTTGGGAERYAVEVAERVAASGHAVHVFTWDSDVPSCHGVTIHRVPKRYRFSGATRLYGFAREAARMLQHSGPFDVVHSHDRTFSQDIATLHTFTHKGGILRRRFLKKIDNMLSPRNHLHLWLERRQMATPVLAAVSPLVAADASSWYAPAGSMHICPPGVDLRHFHPDHAGTQRTAMREKWHIGNNEFVLLFVGTEFYRKGLDILIRSLPADTHLCVVGQGDDRKKIAKALDSRNPSTRITFAGPAQDVRPFYGMADILVLPSRREAFGMVALEAMASGLPVIASSNAGVAAILDHGKNGFLVHSERELTKMLEACRDTAKMGQVASAGRQTALEHCWEKTAKRYERLYDTVRARKNG